MSSVFLCSIFFLCPVIDTIAIISDGCGLLDLDAE